MIENINEICPIEMLETTILELQTVQVLLNTITIESSSDILQEAKKYLKNAKDRWCAAKKLWTIEVCTFDLITKIDNRFDELYMHLDKI